MDERSGLSRREFLAAAAKTGAAGAAAGMVPAGALAPQEAAAAARYLSARRRRTLDAALERMIPADGPQDWSAADVGAGDYIDRLLVGFDADAQTGRIYAGGPYRRQFDEYQSMSRAKRLAWQKEIRRLRTLYTRGLADLDARAGGDFAAAPAERRDAILAQLDLERSAFFATLFAHTMEGVYSHPTYGGNAGYRAWKDLCYQGDVHGVRFPGVGRAGDPWNRFGGYAPSEISKPGECPGQGPS